MARHGAMPGGLAYHHGLTAANVFLPHWRGANSAPSNLSAGLEGPLQGRSKKGERKGREGKRKARKEMEETGKTPLNTLLVTALPATYEHVQNCHSVTQPTSVCTHV